MQKLFAKLLLIFAGIILVVSILISLRGSRLSRQEEVNEKAEIYKEESGEAKYSLGSCKKNSDCTPAGCSNQICSSNPGLVTTCEIKGDFPDKNIYSCGCIEESCVWYKK